MMYSKLILALGAVAALPVVAQKQKTQSKERPNILFILSDDHARPAISAYGSEISKIAQTPNLDKIAQSGVLFNNMLCTNSISGPSRATLITGKFSTTNGFYQNEGGIIFDGSQETSPKLLKAAGYQTSLFGKWHLYSAPTGFDHYMIHDNNELQQGTYWDPIYNTNGTKAVHKGYCTNLTTDAALAWLQESNDPSKPFCMMLNYKAPHRPWQADTKYLTLWDDVEFPYPATFNDDYKGREETLGKNMASVERHLSRADLKMVVPPGFTKEQAKNWLIFGGDGDDQYWTPDNMMSKEEVKKWKYQQYIKDYLRCVKSVDDNVGRVLDYLKEIGQYDNTIIIYMGDQGFFLGEHGLYDKRWMYEESIQMPCMISYPNGIKNGGMREINQIAMNIDIAPTMYDYAGVKPTTKVHGKSLRPLLEQNERETKKWRTSGYYQYFEFPKWHSVQPHYGVRTDRYKLIHFYYSVDTWELYDLEKDPNEINNVIDNAEYKTVVEDLKKEIVKLQKEYNDVMTIDERKALTDKYSINY